MESTETYYETVPTTTTEYRYTNTYMGDNVFQSNAAWGLCYNTDYGYNQRNDDMTMSMCVIKITVLFYGQITTAKDKLS